MTYFDDGDVRLYCADALEALRELPDQSVHMACTSPPFFGLRDYQADGQIGLESSPDQWAARLVDVFREVRRVLRDDGTLWVECGDSYNANYRTGKDGPNSAIQQGNRGTEPFAQGIPHSARRLPDVKPKDLIGQPWLLAFALRADGWYLRSCIIWAKPNCMPESVTDRPTTAHSYVFLFSKRPRYFYDAEALREDSLTGNGASQGIASGKRFGGEAQITTPVSGYGERELRNHPNGKNARSVWQISTEPNALAICRVCDAFWQGGAPREHCGQPVVQHFAAFPRELVRRMILAGTSERGVCAECGAPWVREVEREPSGREERKAKGEPIRHGLDGAAASGAGDFRGLTATTLGWRSSCECGLNLTEKGRKQDETSGCDVHMSTMGAPIRTEELPGAKPRDGLLSLQASAIIPATILDPFAGSGTSLLVARQLGRHAIGIELNERYAAMCKARMSQLSLLA